MLGWRLNERIAGQEGAHSLGLGDSSGPISENAGPGHIFCALTSVPQAHGILS